MCALHIILRSREARQEAPRLSNRSASYTGDPMSVTPRAQIVELEERLRQAMLRSEVDILDELIAPELIFTNHLGQLVTKQDDLAMHQSGMLQLKQLAPSEQHIQIHPGFAVVSVFMHLLGTYENTPINFHIRYTRVWAFSPSGTMQIVAGRASALPPKLI